MISFGNVSLISTKAQNKAKAPFLLVTPPFQIIFLKNNSLGNYKFDEYKCKILNLNLESPLFLQIYLF